MATSRYSTSVSLCEDTSKNFELFDLLKQADPNYSAVDPARIKLYVYDGTKYVETTSGYFTAVDKDTFTVDASLLPNFNGELKVRVLGTDSTGNSFILDITIDVTPVNDAPSGADDSANVASGDVYVLGLADFGFTDAVEGDAFKSVVITSLPSAGTLLLNGVAVTAGQEVLAADVAAGSLTYLAPSDAGGAIGFTFQVRDTGGTDGCGGNDLDLTPNTFTFNVPVPAKAVIGDTVWEDVNGNGLQDAGEAGIGGVTVQLRDPQGNLVQTTTTDSAGKYSFTVNPGSYFVTVVAPNGYAATERDVGANDGIDSDIDGTGLSHLVTVGAGDINNTVDAGLFRTAEIGNRVWLDVNGNGLQDAGEAGVQGVQVRLLDANGNAVEGPITTDANGNYLFSGLKPGVYSIAFDPATLPAGYRFTTRDAGADSADSDVNPQDGTTIQTVLVSGESDLSWDAGIVANPGTISGNVSEDQDNDNTGDSPIAGVTVQLKDPAGNVVQTTTTDANGNYTFNNVPAGNYTVVETNKPGFSDVGDVDGGDPNVISVTLPAGGNSTGNDFVDERLPGVVSGSVLEDNNNDNVGDTPIPGVTVELKDPAGNVVQTTTTDANGNYTFNNVPPGNYTVVETNKPGYTDVGDSDGGNPNTIAVTVTPGSSSTGNVFVDERPATLGDRVWEDKNANGVQDAGEAGIANVTVQLKDTAGNVVSTTTTDANGNYSFSVTPGTYTVAVVKPAGYEITGQDLGGNEATDSDINAAGVTAPVTLQSGQNNPNVDAGLYKLAELGDKVWYDTNKNGVQDAGEAGVQGVKVSLLDAAGNVVTTQTTDTSGNYLFTNLKPGTYSVQFDKATLPTGYVFTSKDVGSDATDSDADTSTGKTIQTVLDSGESDKTWDAGIVANPGSISGTVREDVDNNNTGDTPIAGVTVQLKDSTGTVVQTTTTDANGNYTFNNVPAGNYTVVETNKPGYLDVNDVDGGNPNSIAVNLTPGASSTGNDFVDERTAAIGDKVWLDKNANGVQDAGEAGIAGVAVKLLDSTGTVVGSATTDANGNYQFSNLAPGDYAVQIAAPAGYFVSPKDQGGNDATDSDIDPTTGKTINTTLSAGETDLTWDAGLYQKASLGDKVWMDTNKNGVQDAGEAGVSGVTVKLLDSTGNVVSTATTDANGNYLFKDLVPGNYSVQVVAPAGTSFTGKDLGGNDTTDSDVDSTGKSGVINLESGETDTSVDAGLTQSTASYGDKVWLDKNANGIQEAGEGGIAGVTVKLLNSAGAVVATTTTDANGNYLFDNLTPGDYSAQIVAPTGYFLSAKDQGTNDAIDSDFDPTTGKTVVTTLATGEADLSWDAGLYQKASIGDKVWADCNTNGIQDGNEAGVVGVTVKLLNSAGTVVATTMTDANGNYLFKDLVPGSYSVQVVAPTGYTITAKDQGTNDAVDSDADQATGKTVTTVLESGENDLTWDAGLAAKVVTATFDFNGNMATDGTDGNVLCFTNNGINVNASAFSRDKTTGAWAKAYLGAYGGGLGVTDSSEGSGSGNTHTVDNNGTRDNYVLFEFNQAVVVDKAYLGYVVGDSDAKVWIGTVNGAFDSHITLSDAVLSSMGFTEVNATTLTSARWADLNANGFVGNVLIVAAAPGETNDYFKIQNLVVNTPSAFCATDVSIGDKVWEDTNANGRQDAGEAGIAGVTVKLLNSAGTVLTTTTTDASGNYLFSGLPAGSYKVQVVTPTGYVITTKDATVATDATDSDIDASGISGLYTLTGGSNNLTVDAGFYKARASLGDKVWCDADKDGIQDAGEVGASGVTVKLLDASGTVVATTTTDTNGNYKFSNLNPGDYSVQVVAPTGYAFSAKDQGTNDGADSDVDTVTGKSGVVTLAAGENNVSLDAGIYFKPTTGSIGDRVWEDMNYNGIQDAGEAGIKGVTVKLLNSAGTVVATTTTDASGNYLFSNLNAGNYKVQVVAPTGYYYTKQDQAGWNGTDSAVNSSGYTGTVALAAGESQLKLDAGLYRKASIGDKVWEDKNHNDIQDSTEPGICNVKVLLQNSVGTTIATTYTDVNGNYKFTNLDPGTYRIVFDKSATTYLGVDMSKWYWAAKDVGTDDTKDADAYSTTDVAYTNYTTLVSGEADMTWDAAITPIVLDLDGNGIQTIARENSGGTFDLLGTGKGIGSGWISAGDAFLAIDINHDGKISSVAELFGGYSKGDGFAKLENFDSNGDGYVDAKDAAFGDLRVWQDLNGNHQTDEGELRSLAEAGVASLKVAFTELPAIDEQGNLHLERSSATLADGRSIDMTDVYFNVSVADAEAAGIKLPSLSALLGDDTSLDAALGSTVITVEVTATAATVTNCVSDGAVTALSQLANLYDEQQLALIAA
ncbi:SdrD B-like domain-containing protein [Zoogloea sp.]|uniref:SdrD B-like domain-containing protein n=1 Tax=Zoogloea sp. TaxID=49181 RepID=UPI0025CD7CF1|nr:SdrD B-like domain-containing protein [Zoogloea sp.]MCK6394374.1 carboxypeptidase regulatory-like domain-containing protein [Zoogloea sp.]